MSDALQQMQQAMQANNASKTGVGNIGLGNTLNVFSVMPNIGLHSASEGLANSASMANLSVLNKVFSGLQLGGGLFTSKKGASAVNMGIDNFFLSSGHKGLESASGWDKMDLARNPLTTGMGFNPSSWQISGEGFSAVDLPFAPSAPARAAT